MRHGVARLAPRDWLEVGATATHDDVSADLEGSAIGVQREVALLELVVPLAAELREVGLQDRLEGLVERRVLPVFLVDAEDVLLAEALGQEAVQLGAERIGGVAAHPIELTD